jgi:hypothetical protein
MTKVTPAAGGPAADLSMRSPASWGGGWAAPVDECTLERERLEDRARGADATAQLQRCFPRWTRALEHLTARALDRLARNEPVDPNDLEIWRSRDAHAQAVLHRHGHGKASAARLTSSAITALIDAQGQADRDAGLDWSTVTVPASLLDGRLAHAHEQLSIALEDPTVGVSAGSAARARRAASASRSAGRTICRGGCSRIPASSTPPICAVGGLALTHGSRSPASSSPRSRRSSGHRERPLLRSA